MQNGYSVLMSVYAKEKPEFFKDAIESMLRQTVKTDDFVIICDGSLTERLDEIISYYTNLYPFIFNIIRLSKNNGLGNALNIGVKVCRHELVARMDSDDISVKNRAEIQLQEFEKNSELDVCGGQIAEFFDNPSHITGFRIVPCEPCEIKRFFQSRNPMNHMTVMFRKSSVIKAGNYKDMPLAEDYYLWGRMMCTGSIMKNVPNILVYVRTGNGMIGRRGGITYARKLIHLQQALLDLGLITTSRFMINSFIRTIMSMIPGKIRQLIYNKRLRTSRNNLKLLKEESKMKIVMVVPSLEYKGPVIVAHNIASYCSASNIAVEFISLRKNKAAEKQRFKEFTIIEIGMGKIPSLYTLLCLKRLIKNRQYILAHAHAFYPSLLLSFVGGIKKLVTVHNNPYEDYVLEYGAFIGNFMADLFVSRLKRFDKIIAISKYVQTCISSKGGYPDATHLKRIIVIYNGVEDVFSSDTPLPPSFEETIRLISISVLNQRKNVMLALQVTDECIRNKVDIHCIIIGDGPERVSLEQYVKEHGLTSHVTFKGNQEHSYIYRALSKCHALILTSKSEGFGLVVAEAFMCSCPVIVNNIAVMNELVHHGKNGFICSNISEYVESIKKIKTGDARCYRHNARCSYENRFKLSIMGEAYVKLYRQYEKRSI